MENKIIIALAIVAGGAGIYYFLRNKRQSSPSFDFSTGDFGLPRNTLDPAQMKKAAASGNLRLAQGADLLKFSNIS